MINLFWYSREQLGRGKTINFGDELSKFIVEKVSGKSVQWINPEKQSWFQRSFHTHVLGVGSILHFGAKNSLVWGSGLIDTKSKAPDSNYFAVRGPNTRTELINRGYNVPKIYGDLGLLTSKYFKMNYNNNPKIRIGIIPHYTEYELILNWSKSNDS